LEDARLLLDWLRARYPGLPFSAAGFSFGSRIATRLGCSTEATCRVIAIGFPTLSGDFDYLKSCATPKIFVQSTHDEHGPKESLETVYRGFSEPKQIHWIDAKDHFFRDGLDALEETIYQLKA
jgi:alpha/beta superfamily hydrolase